jgi:poly(3-hydroxybutyrate) depolymerase
MKRQAYTRNLLLVAVILVAVGFSRPTGAAFPGLSVVEGRRPATPPGDDPLDRFFTADDPRDAARAAERLLKNRVEFDILWTRLKAGRRFGAARTGTQQYRFALDGSVFETELEIPTEYDPSRRWPVRVQLHGGVNRPLEGPRRRGPNSLRGEMPQIYVYPRGWNEAQWWHANQVANIQRVIDKLKRQYNVDESLVYITGFSDGGTGAYFFGMRDPTLFSAILPLHGHIGVLENPAVGADGRMFPLNLANRPLFITNGGVDPLYPVARTSRYVEALQRGGVALTFRPLVDVGHDTSWWPSERAAIERFVTEHPREPYPARLSWETERTDRYNRIDWLLVEQIDAPSGRVDLVRRDNTIEATTRSVRKFTLLLSPDALDFSRLVTVKVNGREAFNAMVAKDPAVLLKWAARDNDRTRLYAAELTIEVP